MLKWQTKTEFCETRRKIRQNAQNWEGAMKIGISRVRNVRGRVDESTDDREGVTTSGFHEKEVKICRAFLQNLNSWSGPVV